MERGLSRVASAMTASPLREWLIDIVTNALGLEEPTSVDVAHHLQHLLRKLSLNKGSVSARPFFPLFSIYPVSRRMDHFIASQSESVLTSLAFRIVAAVVSYAFYTLFTCFLGGCCSIAWCNFWCHRNFLRCVFSI
jgi:hypothetical protein